MIAEARKYAERALMARLTNPPKRDRDLSKLRQRIAAIRAGQLDTAPEVQSVLLALEDLVKSSGFSIGARVEPSGRVSAIETVTPAPEVRS